MRYAAAFGALLAGALAACGSGPKDVATPSSDAPAATATSAPTAPAAESYAYVARRSRGVVALAEARHLSDGDAHAMTDALADQLDACARSLEARGELVPGAARVIAQASPGGGAPALNVKLAPGEAVAQNALLCLIAPVRALPFPTATTGTPAIAIEATWEPARSRASDAGS